MHRLQAESKEVDACTVQCQNRVHTDAVVKQSPLMRLSSILVKHRTNGSTLATLGTALTATGLGNGIDIWQFITGRAITKDGSTKPYKMPNTAPLIILDDQASPGKINFFTFVGQSEPNGGSGQWLPEQDSLFTTYNQTITQNEDTEAGFNSGPAVNLTFFGTGATIMGQTGCFDNCTLIVSVDDGANQTVKLKNFEPKNLLFDVQNLDEGSHNIHIDTSQFNLLAIVDYALITPGPNTDVTNQLLYANHTDPAIQFTGEWLERGSAETGNSTQGTSTRGDHVDFTFAEPRKPGSNFTALSILNHTAGGNITLFVTVDGQRSQQITVSTIQDRADREGAIAGAVELYHPLFNFPFDNDATNHSVSIQLLSLSESQVLDIQGFTYRPNFQFLNSSTSVVPEKVTASSGISGPANTGSSGVDTPQTDNDNKLSTGVIAGAVIGSVLGLGLVIAAVVLFLRRRKRKDRQLYAPTLPVRQNSFPGVPSANLAPTPFLKHYSQTDSLEDAASTPFPSHQDTTTNSDHIGSSPFTKSSHQIQVSEATESASSLTEIPARTAAQQPQSQAIGSTENLSQRQILDMLQRLNNRVEELHHPSAYATNIS
ncbi:hypothetical protein D9758_005408 [Tetrapyrgos nigripes]|uniref:Uncharacterized protein n=1 Tax=Tetrapyrgos nigripes TaxID=182062 RepID=A0A8H5GHV3_9AGAR|nr:hypothetical protein D9758_005408 [Tetrapyrgos nigripes]